MIDWKARAETLAEVYHNNYSDRVGGDKLIAEKAVYFFNNNCYKGTATLRDKQLEWFRQRAGERGFVELGYGEHPRRGRDEGCSYAIIIEAHHDQYDELEDLYRESLQLFWDDETS